LLEIRSFDEEGKVSFEEPSWRLVDLKSRKNDVCCMGQGKSISLGLTTRLSSLSTSCLWLSDSDSFGNSLGSATKLATGLASFSASCLSLRVCFTLGLATRLASLSTSCKGISLIDVGIVSESESGPECLGVILSLGDNGGEVSSKLSGMASEETIFLGLGGGLGESIGKGLSGSLNLSTRLAALTTSWSRCTLGFSARLSTLSTSWERFWLGECFTLDLSARLSALSTSWERLGSGVWLSVGKGGRGDGDRENEDPEGVGKLHGR
jgi:hypothetical protein